MPTPIWHGSPALIEEPTSPDWSFGERVTVTRMFQGQYAVVLAAAPLKGSFGTGDVAGYRVSESRVRKLRGDIGQLVIVYETVGQPAQGAALPPDEVNIEANNRLERSLKTHPRYAGLTEEILLRIQDASESGSKATRDAARAAFASNALALELFEKLVRGFSHYVIYPPTVKITSHHWTPPTLVAGGGLQAPPVSTVQLPPGIDWLREGDSLSYNGTHWVRVRSWIGGPDLDTDIYPQL